MNCEGCGHDDHAGRKCYLCALRPGGSCAGLMPADPGGDIARDQRNSGRTPREKRTEDPRS